MAADGLRVNLPQGRGGRPAKLLESPIVSDPLFTVLCLNTFLLLPITGLAAFLVRRRLGTPEHPASPLGITGALAAVLALLAVVAALIALLCAAVADRTFQPHCAALLVANIVVGGLTVRIVEQLVRAIGHHKAAPAMPEVDRALKDWQYRESLNRLGWCALLLPAWMIILASGVLLLPALFAACGLLIAGLFTRFQNVRRLSVLALMARSLSRGRQPPTPPTPPTRIGTAAAGDSALTELLQQLESGAGLAEAVAGVDRLLPSAVANEIAAAQTSGRVVEVLQRNAKRQLARLDEATRMGTWTWLMVYLSVVATVTVSVVTFLSYFIVPKMKKIWSDFGIDVSHSVPHAALVAIEHSGVYLVSAAPLTFFPLFSAVWTLGRRASVRPLANCAPPSPRAAVDQTPELLRVLALLIESQLPLPDGLQQLARYESRPYHRERWLLLATSTAAGVSPWDILAELKLVSEAQAGLLKSAERLGNLPWALRQLADAIERRCELRLQRYAELLQPAFVACIGGWVLLFAGVIFHPLCSLMEQLAASIR